MVILQKSEHASGPGTVGKGAYRADLLKVHTQDRGFAEWSKVESINDSVLGGLTADQLGKCSPDAGGNAHLILLKLLLVVFLAFPLAASNVLLTLSVGVG